MVPVALYYGKVFNVWVGKGRYPALVRDPLELSAIEKLSEVHITHAGLPRTPSGERVVRAEKAFKGGPLYWRQSSLGLAARCDAGLQDADRAVELQVRNLARVGSS